MKEFSGKYGVMVSFEKPVYLNGYFLGFEGWDSINQQFGAENVTFIVRVEFELAGFKENRIKNKGVFYTDSNGLYSIRRELFKREDY